jgi:hypothetical protein
LSISKYYPDIRQEELTKDARTLFMIINTQAEIRNKYIQNTSQKPNPTYSVSQLVGLSVSMSATPISRVVIYSVIQLVIQIISRSSSWMFGVMSNCKQNYFEWLQ